MDSKEYKQFCGQLRALGIVFAAMTIALVLVHVCFGDAPRAVDAVNEAHTDAVALSGQGLDVRGVRYVWCRNPGPESTALVSFIANAVISKTALNFPPNRTGSPIQDIGGGSLVRLDLAGLAPVESSFESISKTWDKIREPHLYLAAVPVEGQKVIPLFGPHVDQVKAAELQSLTNSAIPLVSLESLAVNALQAADGGLYYEFMGIQKSTNKDFTDREAWLISRGVDENVIAVRKSAQRAGLVTSAVTGKVRVIELINSSARLGRNQGIISVTYDPFDESVDDPDFDPFLNLLNFKSDGEEIIFELQNGQLGYVLFAGDGTLVNEAPPNLVADHEIPRPYTRRLQPAISCIRCHSKVGDGGWKPFANEVRDILASFVTIVDDANKGSVPEAVEHVARLYSGLLDKPIRRAREDHSDAIVEIVGSAASEDGTPWQFEHIGSSMADLFSRHLYTPVTAATACRELGFSPEENPIDSFRVLMGTPVDGSEDVRLGLLMIGKSLNRAQWDQVYIDAASRASITQSAGKEM